MSALPKHRELDWKMAIDDCNKKASQGVVKFLDMHIVWDMDMQWSFDTTKTKIAAGDVVRDNLFKSLGFKKSAKKDADLLVIIGENVNGAWIVGKHKMYWLKKTSVQ